jgi:hypothetical protein
MDADRVEAVGVSTHSSGMVTDRPPGTHTMPSIWIGDRNARHRCHLAPHPIVAYPTGVGEASISARV